MGDKIQFIWHIFIFNIIKPFPGSATYFRSRFQTSTDSSRVISHFGQIVKAGKKRFGGQGVILSNLALMCTCLPLCLIADLLIHEANVQSIKIIVNVLLAAIMLAKFDMLFLGDKRSPIKLFYLFSCTVSSAYWTLTAIFLAIFENIGL